jgi:predicted ABC-class ATPase
MTLTKGARYHARIRLGLFEQVAGNRAIRERLEDAGFVGVTVVGSGRDREADGVWGRLTQDVTLPEQVVASSVTCVPA